MDKFQLQRLRDLPIEGVAERLGLQVVRHKCLCPFHDDHHASLSFSPSRNTFRCFACGASGGTIDLAMRCLGKDFLEACRWLGGEDCLGFPSNPSNRSNPSNLSNLSSPSNPSSPSSPSNPSNLSSPSSSFEAARYARFFQHPWLSPAARQFLFQERRLDERVVRWCRLTSWQDRRGVPWLQIPYFDQEGRLVGVQNRNLVKGALPRFRFPSGAECSIYNLPVLNLLHPGEALYIAEGCSDCWSLLSAGHKAIAIPSATLLRKKDAEQLSSLSSSLSLTLHMFPDRDAPGERLFLQLQQLLPNLQHHHLPPDCKDFSDYYLRLKVSG